MSQATIKDYLHHVASKNAGASISAVYSSVNGVLHNGVDDDLSRDVSGSAPPKPGGRAELIQDIPSELQGVSVRDLIKALGWYI